MKGGMEEWLVEEGKKRIEPGREKRVKESRKFEVDKDGRIYLLLTFLTQKSHTEMRSI